LISEAVFTEKAGESPLTVMPNSSIDKQVPNAYVLCTSLERNGVLSKDSDYGGFFEITDLQIFADLVLQELEHDQIMRGCMFGKVSYQNKERHIDEKNKKEVLANLPKEYSDYCFKKPLRFQEEKEYRLMFLPFYDKPILPVEITCPKLLKYCNFVFFDRLADEKVTLR
jgi:hypothetical protein